MVELQRRKKKRRVKFFTRIRNSRDIHNLDYPFAWWQLSVTRFFRKNLRKTTAKNMRATYIALCEIEVDFDKDEKGRVRLRFGFVKTVGTYAGLNTETARQALKMLKRLEMINYGKDRYGHWFILPEFEI